MPPRRCAGGIYSYVEKDGTIVYTNVPPGGARAAKARRVEGELRPAPQVTAPVQMSSDAEAALTQYDELIRDAALRYRIPVNLVRAVMHAESAFDPGAVSAVGASGLMQLMPQTAQQMYVKDIFDAKDNIEGGVRYLRVLANEFDGDMVKMVAAYNAGPDAVRKYGGAVPPFPETQAYVRKVLCALFPVQGAASSQPVGALDAKEPMMSARARDRRTDEEFLAQLYKGGELLAAGKVDRGARPPREGPRAAAEEREGAEPARADLLQAGALRPRRPPSTRGWCGTTRSTPRCGSTWGWST